MSATIEDPHAEAGAKVGAAATVTIGAARLLMELRRKWAQDRTKTREAATQPTNLGSGRDAAHLARLIAYAEAARIAATKEQEATSHTHPEPTAMPGPDSATTTTTDATPLPAAQGTNSRPPQSPVELTDAPHTSGPTAYDVAGQERHRPGGKSHDVIQSEAAVGKVRRDAVAPPEVYAQVAADKVATNSPTGARPTWYEQAYPSPTPKLNNSPTTKPAAAPAPGAAVARAKPKPPQASQGR